ncbi:MAG: hypothetical protein KFH87_00440, partial [Bacteroidetes bacterium]|nr:hypothetical protein [Bacteroidota bacterium]
MKSGRIFWGSLLLVIGVLGLLHNFLDVTICWSALWKLWPLLLVFLGISVFLRDSKSKWIVIAGIGLLTGVVLFSFVQRGCSGIHRAVDGISFNNDGGGQYTAQELHAPWDSAATHALFAFEGGAGKFRIGGTTEEFVSASIRSNISDYSLDTRQDYDMPSFVLNMMDNSVSWKGGNVHNSAHIRLHPDPLWNVDINAGAAKIQCDLREYRIARLDLDAGAADIDIQLGNRADTATVRIQTGASKLRLSVPYDVGCELRSDAALSRRDIRGFVRGEDGIYRSDDFETSD